MMLRIVLVLACGLMAACGSSPESSGQVQSLGSVPASLYRDGDRCYVGLALDPHSPVTTEVVDLESKWCEGR